MNRITSYVFVKTTPDELTDRVAQLIAKGMQPFGSPVMISGTMVGQALVGYEQTPRAQETQTTADS